MDPVNNLRAAYHDLARKVARALHTQLGDGERLRSQRDEVLRFVEDASIVSTHSVIICCTHSQSFTEPRDVLCRGIRHAAGQR